MTLRDAATQRLAEIESSGLRRSLRERDETLINFSSNDYLGLSKLTAVRAALQSARHVGSGGSRLLSGAHPEHAALENDISTFLRRERTLVFSSGYLAAMGAVQTLCELVDGVYSDELNHACVIDALRLARVRRTVYAHRSLPEPAGGRSALIITESVFGMSGEQCDIAGILRSMRPDDVLLLDEAHAIGVAGPDGRGLAGAFADERIVVIGTLSKAIGCAGGFVSGPAEFIELLVNRARTFIFDTSLPPAIAAAANAALRRIMAGDDLRALLRARVAELEDGLIALGLRADRGGSHIQPVILGAAGRAVEVAATLRARGISSPAIRPPTVPEGTARLRISVRADHRPDQIARLCNALAQALA